MNLHDSIAVVTGASQGLGEAFSRALISKNATIYGLARSTDKLQKIRAELGNSFIPVTMDITDHSAIESWVDDTLNDDHQPDILINNAGLAFFNNVDTLPMEDWHTMIETNLSGTFYLTRNVVPLMKHNEHTCHIINIVSIAGKVGTPQLSGYNASKFGMNGFSEALFKELRYDGIKVTSFNPGSTQTNFFNKANNSESHSNMMQPDDVAQVLINILETPDNFLINDITMRPLDPKPPKE